MARDFRYRGHKPHLMPNIFYNQDEVCKFMEAQWEGFRDLAQELGKSWADAEMELVLTQLPDALTIEEEHREQRLAAGWPYEAVYGPLDPSELKSPPPYAFPLYEPCRMDTPLPGVFSRAWTAVGDDTSSARPALASSDSPRDRVG